MKSKVSFLSKKHSLKITQANRVAKEFGNFNRNSIFLLDYLESTIPFKSVLSTGTSITVTAQELYTLLYGYTPRTVLTKKQLDRLSKDIAKMINSSLKTDIGSHKLFKDKVVIYVNDLGQQLLTFHFSKDRAALNYFYNLRRNYFTYTIEEMVSIKSAMALKLYKYVLSMLKDEYEVAFSLNLGTINFIFRDETSKGFADLWHAEEAIKGAVKQLHENDIIGHNLKISFHKTRNSQDGRKADSIVFKVTNLERKDHPAKPAKSDSVLNVVEKNEEITDFSKLISEEAKSNDDISLF